MLQPIFHLFNNLLPSLATYMVLSAILTALPNSLGKGAKGQLKRAKVKPVMPNRVAHYKTSTQERYTYTIPTSMRNRSRD